MVKNIIKILLFKEAQGIVQFFRYGFVSAIALLIDVGILYGMVTIGLNYILSASLAFLCGVAIVYVGSVYWVFAKRSLKDQKKEIIIFVLIGVAGLLLTDVLLVLLVEKFAQSIMVAKLYVTIIVFLFNFITRKFLLFT